MATPTPTFPPQPNSASKKPTGHVSTPSHLGLSSPAPRSVPSPATTRKDHAGKTPINHPTTGSSGSKTIGSTPMVHNLSQTGMTVGSSPGANMMGFGTPVGLGVGMEGITPGQIGNLPTPGLGSLPMAFTASEMGIVPSGGQKRNEDEERRAKMRKVLKSIGRPKGRVSEEGIARLSRRVGFENDIDAEKLTPEERQRKIGNRAFSMAGKKAVIDVELKEQVPQNVQVVIEGESAGLQDQAELAGKVLLADLKQANQSALQGKLDRFAQNLESLARVDRMSSSQVNCFDALNGLYVSLRRLYEQEVKAADELEVMRKKSGKPTMHAHGRLGMEIEYWQQSVHAVPETKQPDGAMDIDREQQTSRISEELLDGTFRLRIDMEPSPASLYPSIRISDAWLPDPLALPPADSAEGIPWQDPASTFISNGEEHDAMALDNGPKQPDVRFTAKLEPPIILPWAVASAMLQSCGLPQPPVYVTPPAWHTMLLSPNSTTPLHETTVMPSVEQTVLTMRGGEEVEVTHRYMLDVAKPDAGFRLAELPFSHPRQLVQVLPTLRQWARVGSLLKTAFSASAGEEQQGHANGMVQTSDSSTSRPSLTLQEILMTPPATPAGWPVNDTLPVTISLVTSPMPTLSLSFPTSAVEADGESEQESTLDNISVQVLPNAELVVLSREYVGGGESTEVGKDSAATESGRKSARALDVCGDLGVWIEWLRNRSV